MFKARRQTLGASQVSVGPHGSNLYHHLLTCGRLPHASPGCSSQNRGPGPQTGSQTSICKLRRTHPALEGPSWRWCRCLSCPSFIRICGLASAAASKQSLVQQTWSQALQAITAARPKSFLKGGGYENRTECVCLTLTMADTAVQVV